MDPRVGETNYTVCGGKIYGIHESPGLLPFSPQAIEGVFFSDCTGFELYDLLHPSRLIGTGTRGVEPEEGWRI